MDSIAIVLGTRPEIIKMSPIISLCLERKVNFFIIHTNQHYSKYLDRVFFKQLRLPQPDYSLNVGSG
ncbi:MAG: UDP-N-acetylglucosamine 2-epimerase (non-hydrolyzing), partial [Candidatus Hermodarchaeota archaeon]